MAAAGLPDMVPPVAVRDLSGSHDLVISVECCMVALITRARLNRLSGAVVNPTQAPGRLTRWAREIPRRDGVEVNFCSISGPLGWALGLLRRAGRACLDRAGRAQFAG